MNKMNEMLTKLQVKAFCSIKKFKDSERGDTNFISMFLIIAICITIASLFAVFVKNIMASLTQKTNDFINGL